jgi:hypothetical protein
LDTVRLVTDKTTRDETGTTFLLGSEGLTIIRRPRVEEEYEIHQDSMRNDCRSYRSFAILPGERCC